LISFPNHYSSLIHPFDVVWSSYWKRPYVMDR
jgi:hypothetical protein